MMVVLWLLPEVAMAAGTLDKESLAYDPANVRFCYLTGSGELNVKLQVQRDGVEKVSLVMGDGKEMPMQFFVENNFYDYYVTQFKPAAKEITYYFKVNAGKETLYFGKNGAVTAKKDVKAFSLAVNNVQTFAVPEWAEGAVIYQIFPDRFYNGDPANDPKAGLSDVYGNQVEVHSWDQLPTNPGKGADFFGGDLQGIIDKLDYLAALGVQAIYLNPINESISNHKYDATDYLKVDDQFGTNELFKRLVDEAKKHGIYVIIDLVLNHTGTNFWAFQDVIKNGENSSYKNWYTIYNYPVNPAQGNYKSWNGYSSLPVLNYTNSDVRKYVLDVVRYWIGLGVKGIRLDAPKEVPHDFWQEVRKAALAIDPEVLVIGEIWDDASAWINGKEFDSTMNYLYRDLMVKFFAQHAKKPASFARELGMDQTRYPEPANLVLYDMVSSHDVERFLTMAQGKVERVKPFVIFQFTYLGAPAIYYGDEVGMEGGKDPDCRRPMVWDPAKQNLELLHLYQQMIQIRRTHPALQHGSYRLVYTDDKAKLLVFERAYQGERILSVLNVGDEAQTLTIPFAGWGIKGEVQDLLSGTVYSAGKAALELQANSGAVLMVK